MTIEPGQTTWGELPTQPVRCRTLVDPSLRGIVNELAIGKRPWPLVLHGAAGSGKTCAGLATLDHFGGIYRAYRGLCDEVAAAKCGRLCNAMGYGVSPAAVWHLWSKCNLAVLDEVGTRERPTDHQYEVMLTALDAREGRPLIVITNLPARGIAAVFDDRVASRLFCGTAVELKGDRRRTV